MYHSRSSVVTSTTGSGQGYPRCARTKPPAAVSGGPEEPTRSRLDSGRGRARRTVPPACRAAGEHAQPPARPNRGLATTAPARCGHPGFREGPRRVRCQRARHPLGDPRPRRLPVPAGVQLACPTGVAGPDLGVGQPLPSSRQDRFPQVLGPGCTNPRRVSRSQPRPAVAVRPASGRKETDQVRAAARRASRAARFGLRPGRFLVERGCRSAPGTGARAFPHRSGRAATAPAGPASDGSLRASLPGLTTSSGRRGPGGQSFQIRLERVVGALLGSAARGSPRRGSQGAPSGPSRFAHSRRTKARAPSLAQSAQLDLVDDGPLT